METRKKAEIGPEGDLIEAVEIIRAEKLENPSLHIKLQEEMAKNGDLCKAAADIDRISRLKAAVL